MSFLTLAQGDPTGKDLLKKAVVARYGPSLPAMDSLRVVYEGRSRGQVGPLPVWARVRATVTYRFPDQMKWDFRIRMLFFFRSGFTTSFDGETVYEQKGLHATPIHDENETKSARLRAWMETVFFFSPLIANDAVRVEGIDAHSFRALLPGQIDDPVIVRLHDDYTLRELEVVRWDPVMKTPRKQFLRPVGGLATVDGLIMPQKLQRFWEDELFMELTPVAAERNPDLAEGEFVLEDEDISAILAEDSEAE